MTKKPGKKALKRYFGGGSLLGYDPLGKGVHGTGARLDVRHRGWQRPKTYVLKSIGDQGFGHEYPSDRAQVFLQALESSNDLPRHVRVIDVISMDAGGNLHSIGGGREYFLLMEYVEGIPYFRDLGELVGRERLEERDRSRVRALAGYLAGLHFEKKEDDPGLYRRKVRDTIGHGECLMGVLDMYPEGTLPDETVADIEKKCIDWRMRIRDRSERLCRVHGDYHPGNIWFKDEETLEFVLLDRSRGPWGEAADDVTALTINYIFFSVMAAGRMEGALREAFELFFQYYIDRTGDRGLLEVLAPFFAFRAAVVCHPGFYPELTAEGREKIIRFTRAVLDTPEFDPSRVNDYLLEGGGDGP